MHVANVDVYRFGPVYLPLFVGKILPFGGMPGKMEMYVSIEFSGDKSMIIWMFVRGER